MDSLKRAIEIAGGLSALAKKLDVAPQVISNWSARKSVPPNRCESIERATDGAVTRRDLRPDIFGDSPVAEQSKAAA